VEAEIVKIDVPPVSGVLINDTDKDFFILQILQIDRDTTKVFFFRAGDTEKDFVVILAHKFDTRRRRCSASDQKTRPRMGDFERYAGERTCRLIEVFFVATNPEFTLMLALHVAPPFRNRVAFNRLIFEGGPVNSPILQRSGFKIEVERFAIGPDGQHAVVSDESEWNAE
jgi:hypothetical protein